MKNGLPRRLDPRALALAARVTLIVTLLQAGPAAAQDVPPARQVLILTRALAYDENLKQRAGGDLLVVVLARGQGNGADPLAPAMVAAFRALVNVKVQGMPLRSTQLAYTTPAALDKAVTDRGIDVLYVCPGLEGELAAIMAVSRKRQLLTLGSRATQVDRGLSLGVFAVEGRPTIVVNLGAARQEGAAFASDLLRLAKVIR